MNGQLQMACLIVHLVGSMQDVHIEYVVGNTLYAVSNTLNIKKVRNFDFKSQKSHNAPLIHCNTIQTSEPQLIVLYATIKVEQSLKCFIFQL